MRSLIISIMPETSTGIKRYAGEINQPHIVSIVGKEQFAKRFL
jgi:hypothetical protein